MVGGIVAEVKATAILRYVSVDVLRSDVIGEGVGVREAKLSSVAPFRSHIVVVELIH